MKKYALGVFTCEVSVKLKIKIIVRSSVQKTAHPCEAL